MHHGALVSELIMMRTQCHSISFVPNIFFVLIFARFYCVYNEGCVLSMTVMATTLDHCQNDRNEHGLNDWMESQLW